MHLLMADYLGTPLPQKLGIKPGLAVIAINVPADYRRLLATIPEGVTLSNQVKPDSSFFAPAQNHKNAPLVCALALAFARPSLRRADRRTRLVPVCALLVSVCYLQNAVFI